MAEQPEEIPPEVPDTEEEVPGYKAPEKKSINEIKNLDQNDDSLRKYKETLLGSNTDVEIDAGNPLNCIVKTLSLVTEDRPDVTLDLTDVKQLNEKVIIIKEGVKYRLKIEFYVQRDIVTGLKYRQTSYRKGIRIDKTSHMVGSYGPKTELQEYLTPWDDAPSGMLARGTYNVKSEFIDDYKKVYLNWDWSFQIKKDWD